MLGGGSRNTTVRAVKCKCGIINLLDILRLSQLNKRLRDPGKLFDCTLVTILTYDNKISVTERKNKIHISGYARL